MAKFLRIIDGIPQSEDEASGGSNNISGTRGSPNNITAAGGIAPGNFRVQTIFVQGNSGNITITATPAISSGSSVLGDILYIVGRNNSQTVTINNQSGQVEMNGSVTLGASDIITFLFDGTAWVEISRNN